MEGKSQVEGYACRGVPNRSRLLAAMIMSYILGGGSLSTGSWMPPRQTGARVRCLLDLNAGIGAGPIQIRAGTNPANADRTAKEI